MKATQIVVAGLSHKTAPVTLREKLAVTGPELCRTLRAARSAAGLREGVLLVTCNRTEIYAVTAAEEWQERLLGFLAERARVSPGQLQEHLYCFEGTPAVRHLFRVAAGLDSMVLGEAQILGQVKEALRQAREAETVSARLQGLFQHAIQAGKRARAETEIGRGAVSVSLAAVQLARQIFGRLQSCTVLVLGAGKMSQQTVRFLVKDGVSPRVLVCNRTPGRAQELAAAIGGQPHPWDDFLAAIGKADIVISSTSAPHAILNPEQARAALRARRGRPLFLIDIAVPRDIDPAVGELDDVYLYNVDDLQNVVAQSLQERQAEAEKVETLLEAEVGRFGEWLLAREVAPTIRELQERAETLAAAEVERLEERFAHLPERDREAVEAVARAVARKLVQRPIVRLRDRAANGKGPEEVEWVRRVFGLDQPPAEEDRE